MPPRGETPVRGPERPWRGTFSLPVHSFGNVVVAIQPSRGYDLDPSEAYHSPDLVPPHRYLAFHAFLRTTFNAHAVVHMGKHGNLEWLPGKALALSQECFPEVALGPMPHVYPFIVNDPGEGAQAKRRAQAVIVDHLTPPLTRAETYGPLRDLEALLDEHAEAASLDPSRAAHLAREIASLCAATGLAEDAGLAGDGTDLARIDAYLCELKEAQIRDGLHVLGESPEGRLERDLVAALLRVPRGDGRGADASLTRALAADLGLGLDPLSCDMGEPWSGPRPEALALSDDPWRTVRATRWSGWSCWRRRSSTAAAWRGARAITCVAGAGNEAPPCPTPPRAARRQSRGLPAARGRRDPRQPLASAARTPTPRRSGPGADAPAEPRPHAR